MCWGRLQRVQAERGWDIDARVLAYALGLRHQATYLPGSAASDPSRWKPAPLDSTVADPVQNDKLHAEAGATELASSVGGATPSPTPLKQRPDHDENHTGQGPGACPLPCASGEALKACKQPWDGDSSLGIEEHQTCVSVKNDGGGADKRGVGAACREEAAGVGATQRSEGSGVDGIVSMLLPGRDQGTGESLWQVAAVACLFGAAVGAVAAVAIQRLLSH